MPRTLPTMLQRFRRHKGGWILLIAALMIKIAAGTACMMDGPRLLSDTPSADRVLAIGGMQADAATSDGDACLLGESGGCHCACAHATALPSAMPALAAVVSLPVVVTHLPVAPSPLFARSPLRPPIA
ncbi:MAG TPA: hypothetical protein VM621_11835 [Luteibacter sp.]|uniref:hypothetical protein n=1 Tax=Luteibacter sp. TaxID=1886636 RepID=UPI002CCF4523|nr:hypothetical protein [Luteibacter sp.]HVI55724.1 hypothetical protein [Luteibacter sp.]